jgi:hypothetical protein
MSTKIAASLAYFAPSLAIAQISVDNPFNPMIGGERVYCTSAGDGRSVAFVANPMLDDVGRARPGFPPTIELNPQLLSLMPNELQLFWYGHE